MSLSALLMFVSAVVPAPTTGGARTRLLKYEVGRERTSTIAFTRGRHKFTIAFICAKRPASGESILIGDVGEPHITRTSIPEYAMLDWGLQRIVMSEGKKKLSIDVAHRVTIPVLTDQFGRPAGALAHRPSKEFADDQLGVYFSSDRLSFTLALNLGDGGAGYVAIVKIDKDQVVGVNTVGEEFFGKNQDMVAKRFSASSHPLPKGYRATKTQ